MNISKDYTDTEIKDLIFNTMYDYFGYLNIDYYDDECEILNSMTDEFYNEIENETKLDYDDLLLKINEFCINNEDRLNIN